MVVQDMSAAAVIEVGVANEQGIDSLDVADSQIRQYDLLCLGKSSRLAISRIVDQRALTNLNHNRQTLADVKQRH